MISTARLRHLQASPQKVRLVVDLIRGKGVEEAASILQLSPKAAARPLAKTLKSAIANAENNAEISADKLWVAKAVVENGPTIPRYWPRARGSAAPIRKKTAHVRVTLTDEKPRKK